LFDAWELPSADAPLPGLRRLDPARLRGVFAFRPPLDAQRSILRALQEGLREAHSLQVPEHWDLVARIAADAAASGRLVGFEEVRAPSQVLKADDVAPAPSTTSSPIEPAKEQLGWFELRIVDPWGEPVGDVDVEVSYAGTRRKVPVPGDGVVRVEEVPTSFGSARLLDPKGVADALKDRFTKPAPKTPPTFENPHVEALGLDMGAAALETFRPTTLVLTKRLTRVRLVGMHFDTNKCFLRAPAMNGIRRVVEIYAAHPTGKLLIVGHTDTTGDDAYNSDLSLERAEATKAYLKDDVAAWEAWFAESKPAQKRWGSSEIAQMIAALPCEKNVAGFQKWSNETRGTDLTVDGMAGPKTRKALIAAYMAIDGTTLPAAIEAVAHGCGEFFPRTDEGDQFGKDGVAADENRRVEIFCFHDEIHPPPPGPKSAKGSPEYPQWKNQVTKTIDLPTGKSTPALVLEWPDHLTEDLPPDLVLSVVLGKKFEMPWAAGSVASGFRRFAFVDVGEGPCTLEAKAGGKTLRLWTAQDVSDPERPPLWEHVLEELATLRDPAVTDAGEGSFPETEVPHGADLS
jgi:outer membrane protein OmpA-like peptidoglycan-associated protein